VGEALEDNVGLLLDAVVGASDVDAEGESV